MDDERFLWNYCQFDRHIAIGCPECVTPLARSRRFGAPLVDPYLQMIGIRSGFAEAGPAELLKKMKPPVLEIADGKVSQVELRDGPFRRQGFHLIQRHAATKKCELVAEGAAVFR